MSLLMQALRKAERARVQNGEVEHAEPLPPPIEGGPAFSVMPDAWRLEPLDAEPPVIPAQEAVHDPVPPQARHETRRAAPPIRSPAPPSSGGSGAHDWMGSEGLGVPPHSPSSTRAEERAVRAGPHAPGPMRAIASSQRRLMALVAVMLGLLLVFGFIYWRAVSGPGPGARLPMVPMPAPGTPPAASGGTLPGAGIAVEPYAAAAYPGGGTGATVGGAGSAVGQTGIAVGAAGAAAGGAGTEVGGARAAASGAGGAGAAVGGAGAAAGGAGAAAGGAGAAVGGAGAAAGGAGAAAGGAGAAVGGAAQPGLGGAPDFVPGAIARPGMGSQADMAAAAPATRPNVDVTVPTPEQLAAIPDPAIRAEAMRDAAERAARQVRHDVASGIGSGSGGSDTQAPLTAAPSGAVITRPAAPAVAAAAASNRQAASAGKRGKPSAVDGATRRARATSGTETGNGRALPTAVGANGNVRFVRGAAPDGIAPAVQNGYNALKTGDLATARQQYDLALLQDPNNRDALLGAAALALREGDGRQASSNYLRLLELDPNDPDALASLSELRGGDLEANEVKLKGVARKYPDSGPVQFALGNLFARQGRWPEAQQSYFRAYSAMPDNADYAFNLGVGLDRMNQPRLAHTYYRRALELAQGSTPAFNVDAVRKRLQALETPPQ
ncbi:hypothetical protein ABT364_07090 [Massilia sp. SR12]